MSQLNFTLIVATLSRTSELEHLLCSLEEQTYKDFSVIVVDQNEDARLGPILRRYQNAFTVEHLLSAPGLSRARNVALPHVTADIVAFPDDDCWYPPNILECVAKNFSEHPEWDGLTARPAKPSGEAWPGWAQGYGILTRRNALRRGTSYTIFLRRKVIESVGNFDETLGAGAGTPWNWAEETDYLLRAMKLGFQIYDHSDLIVFHPYPPGTYDSSACTKEHSQAVGLGHFLRTRQFPIGLSVYLLFRPLAGFFYYLMTGRKRRALHRLTAFRGRIKGYLFD